MSAQTSTFECQIRPLQQENERRARARSPIVRKWCPPCPACFCFYIQELEFIFYHETGTSPLLLPAGQGSNGQRACYLVRHLGRTCSSLVGNCLCACLLPGWRIRVGDPEGRRRRGQAWGCQGSPKGPTALAGSQRHPDVVGGEREAESPCPASDTWLDGSLSQDSCKSPKAKALAKRVEVGFPLVSGGEEASVSEKGNPAKGAEIRKDQKPQWHHLTHGCPPPTSLAASRRLSPHSCLSLQRSGDAERGALAVGFQFQVGWPLSALVPLSECPSPPLGLCFRICKMGLRLE